MEQYASEYSESYALFIATDSEYATKGMYSLSEILKQSPYKFSVILLADKSATHSAIKNALRELQTSDPDARILIFVAGKIAVDSNGKQHLICYDTNVEKLSETAISYESVLKFSHQTSAKHIAFILDTPINLSEFNHILEISTTEWGRHIERKAYQLLMRAKDTECISLAPLLTEILDTYSHTDIISISSIAYESPNTCYSKLFDIQGTQKGSFTFYTPPLAGLPIEIRQTLTHQDILVRLVSITEARRYLNSETHKKYAIQALQHLAEDDPDPQVRLRAKSVLDSTGSELDNSDWNNKLSKYSEIIASIIGDPFELSFVPAGTITLIDEMLVVTSDHRKLVVPREYVPDSDIQYLPRGGKTYTVDHFAMGRYAITQEQFSAFVKNDYYDSKWWEFNSRAFEWYKNNTEPISKLAEGSNHPIVNVNWYEAIAFCLWLSDRTGLPILLPNELQWQRSAQGDDFRLYSWGNSYPTEKDACWKHSTSVSVNSFGRQANLSPYGLYHMSGNVWEWCTSAFRGGSTDISMSQSDTRVIRGGDWSVTTDIMLRTTYRTQAREHARSPSIGFRIMCTLDSEL